MLKKLMLTHDYSFLYLLVFNVLCTSSFATDEDDYI